MAAAGNTGFTRPSDNFQNIQNRSRNVRSNAGAVGQNMTSMTGIKGNR
jgi:hypothetical protein